MALSDFSKVSLFDIAHSDNTETSGDEGGSAVTDSAQAKSSDEEDTLDKEEEIEMNTRELLLLTSISDYQ